MRQIFTITPTGRMNRRDLPNLIEDNEVLIRENWQVIGNGKEKRNRKVPGASRFSDTNIGASYVSGHRYYTGPQVRKTFAFNNGKLYHISDNGVEDEVGIPFSPTAIGCWEQVRVSSNDLAMFSDGISGIFSHDGNIDNVFVQETTSANPVDMLIHLDRLFYVEENSEDLGFSKTLEPFNLTDSTDAGLITIGPRRGEKIMKIALLRGVIYIFKQNSVWRLTGRTPSEFQVEEVHPFLGVAARRSVINTDNGIIFLGSDHEFYFFGGTIESTIMLTYKVAIGGDLTKNLLPIINKDKMDSVVATFHNKIYRCSFTENAQVTNNLEWCFDTINETDFFTRGFNISCYIKWDRSPDKQELITGRTDLGRLMKMNVGLNVDNEATSPSMRYRLQTKFVGSGEPYNIRFKRAHFTFGVLGASVVKCFYHVDCRNLRSGAGSDNWATRGETRSPSSMITISTQQAISSRVVLEYGKSKGQNISFEFDNDERDRDIELAYISVEAIVRKVKKSEKVGV